MWRTRIMFVGLPALLACSEPAPPPEETSPCAPGDLVVDGGCLAPGVDACAEGFTFQNGGCLPVLPEQACPPGMMAVPGDTACRAVSDCGEGTWGAIVTDASTQHVDLAYLGDDSDGSAARPWSTIQQGIDHAVAGATVAVAAGAYAEDLTLTSAIVVSGRCAELVTLRGSSPNTVRIEADGAALRGMSLTGPERGIWVTGAAGVVIEDVRVHDTTVGGILIGDGPDTHATLRNVLVENPGGMGVWLGGGALVVERSLIRGATGTPGRGLLAHQGPNSGAANSLNVSGSVLEGHADAGLTFSCGDVAITGTVVRDSGGGGDMGAGIGAAECLLAQHATYLSLETSVLERNGHYGLFLAGVDAAIANTSIRNTFAVENGGEGIHVAQGFTTKRVGDVTVSRSLIDASVEAGVAVYGASVAADRLLVTNTLPSSTYPNGNAIHLQTGEDGVRASLSLTGARLLNNAGIGVLLLSADAALERVAVIDELPISPSQARVGVLATYVPWDLYPAQLRMHDSDVAGSVYFGVYVLNADAHVSSSRIRDIRTADTGRYGDGVTVASGVGVPEAPRGTLLLEETTIARAARAGLASFGGDVVFGQSTFACNHIAVNAETDLAVGDHQTYSFDDRGDNRCGCGDRMGACEIVSSTLEPLDEPIPLVREP